jgi:hypothetical protein
MPMFDMIVGVCPVSALVTDLLEVYPSDSGALRTSRDAPARVVLLVEVLDRIGRAGFYFAATGRDVRTCG